MRDVHRGERPLLLRDPGPRGPLHLHGHGEALPVSDPHHDALLDHALHYWCASGSSLMWGARAFLLAAWRPALIDALDRYRVHLERLDEPDWDLRRFVELAREAHGSLPNQQPPCVARALHGAVLHANPHVREVARDYALRAG